MVPKLTNHRTNPGQQLEKLTETCGCNPAVVIKAKIDKSAVGCWEHFTKLLNAFVLHGLQDKLCAGACCPIYVEIKLSQAVP